MKYLKLISSMALALGLATSTAEVSAHGTGSGDSMEGMIVTRHFTGIWDQVDQEAQGLALQVIEQLDDSRRSVAYWYTYGPDRQTAWFMAIGDLIDNRIEFELYESSDVGFMQGSQPVNDSVTSIGTMTIEFDSCESGIVTYATNHADVGSGSFGIERILEVMNTHCTGGMSDDMHADAMFGEQRMVFESAREGVNGSGHTRYEDYPGHMEFEVEVEGLPDGSYHLYAGMHDRGDFEVMNGHGEMNFSSPGEDGHMLLNFDPHGMQVEIHDGQGVVLSTFDNMFEEDDHGHNGSGGGGHGGDHDYDCDSGSGMGGGMGGGGMMDCVDDGEFVGIEADLNNTGVIADAEGEAEWEMNSVRVEFSVEIEDVPAGSYALHVGGTEVGVIDAFEMHGGAVYGRITFRDPETNGRVHLDFEPRGQKIEVLQGAEVILEVEFPTE